MKTSCVILFLVLSSFNLFSQKQANIWHFGDSICVDFTSGAPVQIPGSSQATFEGCASYCDSLGNLLMYTNGGGREPLFSGQDGGHIWNRNNEIMYDMQGIEGGGFSAAQSSVIVEAPGEEAVYYVFTMDEGEFNVGASDATNAAQPLGRGFSYFKVDMTLNGGLGDVVVADQRVHVPTSEGLCAVRHANGNDYWIMIHQDSSGLGVYRVNSSGVALANVYTTLGRSNNIIKASPSQEWVIAQFSNDTSITTYLLQFDDNSGTLSSPFSLGSDFFFFEFSPNSRYLYATNLTSNGTLELKQFDLQAPDILASAQLLGVLPPLCGGMQLGPDGKIYFLSLSTGSGSMTLNRINCPNTATPSLELDLLNFTGDVFLFLPNFPAWLFENDDELTVNLGPATLEVCDADFPITLNAQNPGATYLWSTGATTQTIDVSAPGTYSVTVTGDCGSGSSEIVVLPCTVAEDPCAAFDLGDTLTVCGNDTVQLQANLSSFTNVLGLQWSGGAGTFIPADTVANGRYVPSAAERAQGFVNLSLQVNASTTIAGQGGKLIAYDHLNEDLIFYISPLDGSIDTIQDNAGDDWIATGFESSTSTLYGVSVFQGLGSVNTETGVENPINFGYAQDIFSGEFDNGNGIFYAVGAPEQTTVDPVNQQLYTINTSTGALTVVGDLNLFTSSASYFGLEDGINGLAYDPGDNVLYGISYVGNLYRINVSDASTTLIGPTQNDCRGLAYDASTQKLWAINSTATLFEIDKNTGSVLSTVPCQEPFNFITSLTYAPSTTEIQEITCSDTLHIVFAPNNFLDLGNDTLLCNTTEFTLSQPGFTQYLWQDGSESNSFEVTESGQYTLQATSNAGCVDTDTVQIQLAIPSLSATASPTTIILGDTAQLSTVSNATSYVWTPDEGLSCSNCPNPLATPVETTEYIVFATDSFGCRVSDTLIITVDIRCNEVFIPTIFSPNKKGPEANETFCVYSDCVEQFKLVIHNRWGQRIFETEDISTCWDGTFNGQEAQSGVYAFNLYLRQLDGTVVNKTGTITLVK